NYSPALRPVTGGGAWGGRRNPSLIRDLVTGQVIRPA
ncbi:tRNA threonylcarbamoyladenosine biosynthesis protein RimN, partial [Pseudomonas aeruginosa]|nr:tRNA threonylcarbamoyladenosine biosynthesis protein RimN [Pseudomonas aeruginosa]